LASCQAAIATAPKPRLTRNRYSSAYQGLELGGVLPKCGWDTLSGAGTFDADTAPEAAGPQIETEDRNFPSGPRAG
jgi:hypothetical protein